ncbi:hypothetical protein HZS_2301 [Henneguya salminicola]|nr:hypothetical protein HZS_2301 [Henneguya salminicola]
MYPQNEIKDWYVKILSEYNIEHSTFKHKIKKYTLPGSYRHIFVWPTDLYFETINYSVDAPLIISDKDSLLVPSQLNDDRSMPNNSLHLENSLKMALKLKFSLPASAYATCFLREIFNEKQSIV